MFSLKSNARGKNNDSSGQLKKLRRQDLLELLVEQLGENERLSAQIDELQAANAALTDQVERLKGKLDDKDAEASFFGDPEIAPRQFGPTFGPGPAGGRR